MIEAIGITQKGNRRTRVERHSPFPLSNRLVILLFSYIKCTHYVVSIGYGIIHGKGFLDQFYTFLNSFLRGLCAAHPIINHVGSTKVNITHWILWTHSNSLLYHPPGHIV